MPSRSAPAATSSAQVKLTKKERETSLYPRQFDWGAATFQSSYGAAELAARSGTRQKAIRVYTNPDVVGVDWRVPLHEAWERVGFDVGIQGNLDPAVCLAPWEAVEAKALAVLRRAGGRDGHVFNLGHGVLPDTPVENLQRLVDLVHERTERGAPGLGEELP